jgi:hypothetical protein
MRPSQIAALFTRYFYSDHIKKDEVGRTCSTHGEMKHSYRMLVGKREGEETTRKT